MKGKILIRKDKDGMRSLLWFGHKFYFAAAIYNSHQFQ